MKRLVIALLVLVGLLVAVDFGAAALTESAVSRQMREQIGLADDPSVRINGFPFLTQALSGEYHSVDVSASRITVDELRELDVRAQLRDVIAPLPMLLGSGPKTLLVQEVEGTVRISPNDLERFIPGIDRLRIETIDAEALAQAVEDGGEASLAEIDPDRAARFVATRMMFGQELEVSVVAVLELVDGRAQIVPRDVRLGGDAPALPAVAQQALAQLFTVRIDPGSLPLQVTPTALRARDGALEISGTSQNLVLGAALSAASR